MAAIAALVLLASIPFDNTTRRSAPGILPFFSGAAHYEFGQGWRYCEEDFVRFLALPSREARDHYRFEPDPDCDLRHYDLAAKGYLWVAIAARNVFFWMGDLKAVETVQVIGHIVLTLFVLAQLRRRLSKWLFLLLYGLNPLLLWFASYPVYYFWQAVPGGMVAAYLLRRDMRLGWWTLAVGGLLGFCFAIRPTVVFVSGFLLVLVMLRESWKYAIAGGLVFLLAGFVVFGGSHQTDPWHTAYVGIAAYPNPYVQEFHDRAAHRVWEEKSGERLDKGPYGNYREPGVVAETSEAKREAFLAIARESPGMLARNAFFNLLQSFSLGYVTDFPPLTAVSTILGAIVIGVLAWRRRWGFLVAIAASSASFVVFFPPIQIYMYGSYVLLVAAAIDIARELPAYSRWSHRLPELPALGDGTA